MIELLPYIGLDNQRLMIFVDGENLAIRFASVLKRREIEVLEMDWYKPNVFVWHPDLNRPSGVAGVVRKYYYTSLSGDDLLRSRVVACLKAEGIEAPRVFKKEHGKRTKQVDISLAVDMLLHATRKNFDTAVLIAGDQDYVPLVRAVQSEGCRVHLWFFNDGLSPRLKETVDAFSDVEELFVGRAMNAVSRIASAHARDQAGIRLRE